MSLEMYARMDQVLWQDATMDFHNQRGKKPLKTNGKMPPWIFTTKEARSHSNTLVRRLTSLASPCYECISLLGEVV